MEKQSLRKIHFRFLVCKKIMNLAIELEQETDGRWIAEIDALNGILVYGETREEAIRKVGILALQVIDERLENEN